METTTICVLVDVFWPHPLAKDESLTEHKCHKQEMVEFPSLFFLYSNNDKLMTFLSERYKNPYTGKTLLAKATCIYRENLFPEKIVVFLKSPLRLEPVDFLAEQRKEKEVNS